MRHLEKRHTIPVKFTRQELERVEKSANGNLPTWIHGIVMQVVDQMESPRNTAPTEPIEIPTPEPEPVPESTFAVNVDPDAILARSVGAPEEVPVIDLPPLPIMEPMPLQPTKPEPPPQFRQSVQGWNDPDEVARFHMKYGRPPMPHEWRLWEAGRI